MTRSLARQAKNSHVHAWRLEVGQLGLPKTRMCRPTLATSSPPPRRRFVGKVAVVTASTDGIGLAIALRLGREGARVFISSRKKDNVDRALVFLRDKGIDAQGLSCNVGVKDDVKRLIQTAQSWYGRVDVLISNAAVNPYFGPLLSTPETAWDKIFDVNVKASLLLVQSFAHLLSNKASVVFVSSISAYEAMPGLAPYAISKTALLALSRALAVELGPRGIRVNCVAPGVIETQFSQKLTESPPDKRFIAGRYGRPEEVAASVAFLASDDASYITGENLAVAGGLYSRL